MTYQRLDRPRLALVTGSSSGIGFELARKLAAAGYDVVMTSANRGKLSAAARVLMKESPTVEIQMVVADLSVPDGPRQLQTEIQLLRRPLDILVNNAGVGVWGHFSETDIRDEISMVQLNVISLMALTKLFLPQMLRLHEGRILFTADETAAVPAPRLAAYAATKAFAASFARSLRAELNGTGVHVDAVLPGATRTNFFDRAGVPLNKTAKAHLAAPADVAREAFEMLAPEDARLPLLGRLMAVTGLQSDRAKPS
jgi:short-subunit dehydrogenase